MIVDHANPKVQPGGVHGAFTRPKYQSEGTPLPVKTTPIASPPKWIAKNIINRNIVFVISKT